MLETNEERNGNTALTRESDRYGTLPRCCQRVLHVWTFLDGTERGSRISDIAGTLCATRFTFERSSPQLKTFPK